MAEPATAHVAAELASTMDFFCGSKNQTRVSKEKTMKNETRRLG